jgi:hypothetical protein
MSVLPSVQPFHAIAYPIDPILALEIRFEADFLILNTHENTCLYYLYVYAYFL